MLMNKSIINTVLFTRHFYVSILLMVILSFYTCVFINKNHEDTLKSPLLVNATLLGSKIFCR